MCKTKDRFIRVDNHKKLWVLKYGGNAMIRETVKTELLKRICELYQGGIKIVLVHGGGPFIQQALEEAKIESEFVAGQRKTSARALEYVEMALKGRVNGNLVRIINSMGCKAAGLSGKDGQCVTAIKRYHLQESDAGIQKIDLGHVGNVKEVDPTLIHLLLDNGYLPVMTCIASDDSGNDYNINGDVFAGHIAGALKADQFILLTDVDGLLKNVSDPDSVISDLTSDRIEELIKSGVILGGMLPKVEACITALKTGAKSAHIINGTKPEQLTALAEGESTGTQIK